MINQESPSIIRSQLIGTESFLLLPIIKWSIVTFIKVSSGSVIVGSNQDLIAATNGGGIALPADVPIKLLVAPGSNIYAIGSTANEIVNIHIQSIDGLITQVFDVLQTITRPPQPMTQQPTPDKPWFSADPGFRAWADPKSDKAGKSK